MLAEQAVVIGEELRVAYNESRIRSQRDIEQFLSRKTASWNVYKSQIMGGFVKKQCSHDRNAGIWKVQISLGKKCALPEVRDWVKEQLESVTGEEWNNSSDYLNVTSKEGVDKIIRWINDPAFTEKVILYADKPKRTDSEIKTLCEKYGLDTDSVLGKYAEVRDRSVSEKTQDEIKEASVNLSPKESIDMIVDSFEGDEEKVEKLISYIRSRSQMNQINEIF